MDCNDVTSVDKKETVGSRPPLLPPCRVCGGKASGFHYGVNTCEACKVCFTYIYNEAYIIKVHASMPSLGQSDSWKYFL
jgi:hypothetical protein